MFANKKLLTMMSPDDKYVHRETQHHSQPIFMRLCMIILLSLVGLGSAWADDVVTATQTITNDGKTSTWTNINAAVTKGNALGGNGLYFVPGTSGNISTSSGTVQVQTGRVFYVQVPSASALGSITIIGSDNYDGTVDGKAERTVSLNSGPTIAMNKTTGKSANFVAGDIENVNDGYYVKLTSNADFKFTQVSITLTSSDSYSGGSTPGKTTLAGGHIYEKIYIGKGSNTFTPSTAANQLKITKGGSDATYDTDYTMSYALTSGSSVELTNTTSGATRSTNTLGESTVTATVTPTDAISETYSGFTFPFTYVVTDRKSDNTGVDGLTALDKAWTWTPEDVANKRYYQDYHAGDGTYDYIFVKSSETSNSGVRAKLQSGAQIAFKLGAKMDVTISSQAHASRHFVISTADDAEHVIQSGNDNEASHTFTLEEGTYYIGAKQGGAESQLYVKSIQFTPHVDLLSADFTYGQTSWTSPALDEMTITIPAHKAGQTINVTVTPEDGATLGTITGGLKSGNTVSFTAPAAGSNTTVTIPVTKDAATTDYTIAVNTESKVGQTFDATKRYSQILIDARKDDFWSNTHSGGLSYLKDGSYLDYVPGLVAKSIIDAVDYYKDHQTAIIDNAKLQSWFNAVKTYGDNAITTAGSKGQSFDDLNAVKIYFGLKDVAVSGSVTGITADNDAWNNKLNTALTSIRTASQSYAISSSHATYPISIADMQGGLWHKSDYINQMWGDGQYMGTAFLAQLINDAAVYDATNESKRVTADDWNYVAQQLKIYHTYAWDNTANLPHHAFAADKGQGTSAEKSHSNTWVYDGTTYRNEGIWARATGWYFMALVDVLEQMPKDNPRYNEVKGYLSAVAAGVKARQDAATGLWYQLPIFDETFSALGSDYKSTKALSGRKYNYLESSASALFIAAYLKAIRLGLLDKATYEATAKKAYQGFIENFLDANNNIAWSCRSAGLGGNGSAYAENGDKYRDGSNAYYLVGPDVARVEPSENKTEGKALGAFIMAAVEYERAYIHDVTFVSGPEGTAPAVASAVSTLPDVAPSNVKTGYTFNGWYKNDGTKVNADAAVTEDLTLYANYTFAGTEKFSMTVKAGEEITGLGANENADLASHATISASGSALVHNGSTSAQTLLNNGVVNLGGSGNSYLKVTLPQALAEGDVINIAQEGVFRLTKTDAKTPCENTSGGVYTVATGDNLIGSSDVYVWKAGMGSDAYMISKLTVTSSGIQAPSVEGASTDTPNAVTVGDRITVTVPAGATNYYAKWDGSAALTVDAIAVEANKRVIPVNNTETFGTPSTAGTHYLYLVAEANGTMSELVKYEYTVSASTGGNKAGVIEWLDMASTGHNADVQGEASSYGITPAKGVVVGLTPNGSKKLNDVTYYRYQGVPTAADKDNYYIEYSFSEATGYTFTPSDIQIDWIPNGSSSVTLDVYVGTTSDNLAPIKALKHNSDTRGTDIVDYTDHFTILRLVPSASSTGKSIILNNVIINGTVTEPAATVHTVTFNANGHAAAVSPASVTESEIGAGVQLPQQDATHKGLIPHAGYTFLGWSINQNATTPDAGLEADKTTYFPASDVTLYAVYRNDNTVGSAQTDWWRAFSDFIELTPGNAYTATFTVNGNAEASWKNWVLIATDNNVGHNGDGKQIGSGNELFALRADAFVWGVESLVNDGTVKRYKNDGGNFRDFAVEDNDEFTQDMVNATVNFSAAFVGKRLYLYVTTEVEGVVKYVETYQSAELLGNLTYNKLYLSFATENSSITFTGQALDLKASILKKDNDDLILNGTVDAITSPEGINLDGFGVAEGAKFMVATTPADGYVLDAVTVNGVAYPAATEFVMPESEAIVGANFKAGEVVKYNYTVKAIGPNSTVLNDNLASGEYTVGDAAVTVAYPQFIKVGTELYEIDKQYNGSSDYYRYTFTPDKDDYEVNLPYTKSKVSNVVAYVEAEGISGFAATTGNAARASNGAAARSTDRRQAVTLRAGTYKIYMRSVNGDNARTVTFTDASSNVLFTQEVAKADYSIKSSDMFAFDAENTIYVSCQGSSASGLDWFYVQEINVLTVTSNGQKYAFTEENVTGDKYASANASGVSGTLTRDDVEGKFYNIKTTDNYVELDETGAIAFKVFAYHGNGSETRTVNVYVDGEKIGEVSVTPGPGVSSSVFVIPGSKTDIHNITLMGGGRDVYVADVVLYTEKVDPSVTPANIAVNVLQTKTLAVSAPEDCTITSMDAVTSDVADVNYSDGQITVVGKNVGNVTVKFNITSENSLFNSGKANVNITVGKAQLVMKYNPDAVIIEKGAKKELPAGLQIDYYVVEDGEERLLDDAPSGVAPGSYTTTDNTVANVNILTGEITFGTSAGGTDITATFAGNTNFSSAKASVSILVKDGFEYKISGDSGPEVNSGFTVKDDSDKVLVYGTFGGWKRNSHKYENTQDFWAAPADYGNAIDGFSKYTSGKNDASDEDRDPSTDIIYGSYRRGWFESPVTGFTNEGKPNVTKSTAPFSLPVRGTYMTFEPTKNGQLTVYILQNGAWNSSKKDVKDDDGFLVSVDENGSAIAFPGMAPWQFRPHSFYVTDQNGMPVEVYTDFKINTKQPIESGIITEEKLNLKDKNSKPLYTDAQKAMVNRYCEKYGVKLGEKFKCILNPTVDGYHDATNIGNWKEFKQYMSPAEQQRVYDAWNTGVNGAEKIVKLDNGSYLAVDECIMKYSFYVAAGQTYYLFSNFSKMGFSGCNFIPDETAGAQPTATLALSERTAYSDPSLNPVEGEGNHVKKITVPQYETITLDRTFKADTWNTIYLPFVMTEKEVRDVFGEKTQLILLNRTFLDENDNDKLNIEFIYHEIQSILAGYPYLIKPSKAVAAGQIVVHNKVLQPDSPEMRFGDGDYVAHGTPEYCSASVVYENNGKTYSGYSAKLEKGDIYLNGGDLYIAGKTPVYSRGYRSYIEYVGEDRDNAAKSISLYYLGGNAIDDDESDNVATYINFAELSDEALEDLGIKTVMNGVYNLSGQKVAEKADNLPAGLYIINGKKVSIVK